MQYPATWANQPPSSETANGLAEAAPDLQNITQAIRKPTEDNCQVPNQIAVDNVTSRSSNATQQQPYTGANSQAATAAAAHQGSNPQQAFSMQSKFVPQATMPHNGVTLQSASGQKRVIAIRPRKTHRAVQPGFTSSGEKILYIQLLGMVGNARFVVTDAEGNVRLVSASSAGGQPALEGAKKAGIPYTLQDPTEIQKLRDLVRCGGVYGVEFVAIGEWDMSNKRLPFIVVLFYHENENGRREAAISRSSLAKILATREAEKLVVESITGNPDMSLKEALMSQLSLNGQGGIPLNDNGPLPLPLPQGEQTQPWWFQSTPQPGSFPAFHTGPTQQQYSNSPIQFASQHIQQSAPYKFQQFIPHQFLQPFPQQYHQPFGPQFQSGPFSMTPQPILDPHMMKHGANSPAASLMMEDEEL